MRKLLIRAYISPLDTFTTQDIIIRDRLGTNSGNMLYAFSVMRTLMTEDTQIDIDNYYAERGFYTNEDVERINSEYEAYILPLADAFRSDFRNQLKELTSFIRKLTIPVYLIGMGARLVNEDYEAEYDFDKEAQEFIKTVLDKTTIIGVRGKNTAGYFKRFGFVEDKDFTIIGCPSLFTYGKHLTQKPLELKPDSIISVNYSDWTPLRTIRKVWSVIERYPNSLFVGQNDTELESLYFGVDNPSFAAKREREIKAAIKRGESTARFEVEECYMDKWTNSIYQQDRMRFFTDVPSWLNYMKGIDLSFGARLHGNIVAILAGTPAFIIAKDGRIIELCEYHNLPSIRYDNVAKDATFESLIDGVDLQSHLKTHEEKFNHFIDFLDRNGIEHIYKEDRNRKDAPMDDILPPAAEPIRSFVSCTDEEKIARLQEQYKLSSEYTHLVQASRHKFAEKSNSLDSELKNTRKILNDTREELDMTKKELNLGTENLVNMKKDLEKTREDLKNCKAKLATTQEHVRKLEKIPSYRVYKGLKKVGKKLKKQS